MLPNIYHRLAIALCLFYSLELAKESTDVETEAQQLSELGGDLKVRLDALSVSTSKRTYLVCACIYFPMISRRANLLSLSITSGSEIFNLDVAVHIFHESLLI